MLAKKPFEIFAAAVLLICFASDVNAQVVAGTGQELTELSDDFEDPHWSYTLNLPKASTNIDKVDRQPAGYSANGLWFESTYRGTPDFVKRVDTPPEGLPGSTGAMAMQTLYSGIPGQLSHKFQQDDLIANVSTKLGHMIPAAWTPSYVVRVYLPPFETWEQRNGSSFGFRADCQTIINKPTKMGRFFKTNGTTREMEQYWPGFFIQFNAKNHPQHTDKNSATILIRSGERGEDIPGPTITQPGWWTLGMTITPDGKVHYYGHAGIGKLTHRDHLYSNFPYGYKCLQTSTYFFNIVNQDDGRTWSTRWIIDDPKVYVATRPYTPQTAQQVNAQPVSQTKPAAPATPATSAAPATTPAAPAKPAALTTPATPGTVPAAIPPVLPAPASVPALLTPPTAPASTIQPQAPASNSLPALNTAPLPASQTPAPAAEPKAAELPALRSGITAPASIPKLEAADTNRAKPGNSPRLSAIATVNLPPLLATPVPVITIPVISTHGAALPTIPAPALLPEESAKESAPLTAPVIATPAPAPIAPPQDDVPVLPDSDEPADAAAPSLLPPKN